MSNFRQVIYSENDELVKESIVELDNRIKPKGVEVIFSKIKNLIIFLRIKKKELSRRN